MNLELVSDYKENDVLRRSFDELSQQVFGISFEKWYQLGLWNDRYICHSYRDGDKIAANVSVSKMRLKRAGREKKILQIGTVMTAADYRGKGLAGSLMEYVSNQYQDSYEAFFLFANKNVLNFYPRYGFKMTKRRQFFTREIFADRPSSGPSFRFRRLDMEKPGDVKILTEIAEERIPTSDKFFIENAQGILYWYCLSIFKNNIYYNDDEGIVLIYDIEGDIINIYDIITRKAIPCKDILRSIYQEGISETVFHFNLESGELNIESRVFDDLGEDDPMFIKGDLVMKGVTFPITAHT